MLSRTSLFSTCVAPFELSKVCRRLFAPAADVQWVARSICSRLEVAIISHLKEYKPSWIGSFESLPSPARKDQWH